MNMKTKTVRNKNELVRDKSLKWHTYEAVFGNSQKSPSFKRAYSEEMSRLQIAKQVRVFRNLKHFTQKDIADRAGMPQSVVARIESGERGITLDTLGRIASALGKEIQLT